MAKGRNQKLKLLYLIKILMEKTDENHSLTLQEIREELERYDVSAERKSLYDDFKMLGDFGMDIVGDAVGKSYGYRLASRDFEVAELKLLVDAIQASKFISEAKSQELIKKLEALASHYQGSQLQRQVYMIGRPKTTNENVFYAVDGIYSAIMENKQIRFKYFSWNVNREMEYKRDGGYYEVSPWALCWDDENYYMIAYDAEAGIIKHYRVDKMTKVVTSEAERMGKELFDEIDLAGYTQRYFGMFDGKIENVKLCFQKGMANVVVDRFGKDVMLVPQKDGTFHVNVSVATSDLFLSWIFGLGDQVEVISPDSVRERLREKAQSILERYKV